MIRPARQYFILPRGAALFSSTILGSCTSHPSTSQLPGCPFSKLPPHPISDPPCSPLCRFRCRHRAQVYKVLEKLEHPSRLKGASLCIFVPLYLCTTIPYNTVLQYTSCESRHSSTCVWRIIASILYQASSPELSNGTSSAPKRISPFLSQSRRAFIFFLLSGSAVAISDLFFEIINSNFAIRQQLAKASPKGTAPFFGQQRNGDKEGFAKLSHNWLKEPKASHPIWRVRHKLAQALFAGASRDTTMPWAWP
jgi:hypothetical protein